MGMSIAPNSFTAKATDPLLVVLRKRVKAPETVQYLSVYLAGLREELERIDDSELHIPFTKALLIDAIQVVMEDLKKFNESKPVLKQLLPMKRSCVDEYDKRMDIGHRGKRMSKDESHSTIIDFNSDNLTLGLDNFYKEWEDQTELLACDNQSQSGKNEGIRPSKSCLTHRPAIVGEEDVEGLLDSDLSLSTPETKSSKILGINAIASKPHCNRSSRSSSVRNVHLNFKTGQQEPGRKQRRCWSPELHERFVRALEQLGGPQAATPKLIRELMRVDGLTNDEVKSHLQGSKHWLCLTLSWFDDDSRIPEAVPFPVQFP